MKKIVDMMLVAAMLMSSIPGLAEDVTQGMPPAQSEPGTPPEMPDGMPEGQQPPEMPDRQMPGGMPGGGHPPEMPDGQRPDGDRPPEMPDGPMPNGMPDGMSQQPDSYDAVLTIDKDTTSTGEIITSTDADENAILVVGGTSVITETSVSRESSVSTGGDSASFYGVGAAILATGGEVTVTDSVITTDSNGGAGLFAYSGGVIRVSDTVITTLRNTSGGIHVAGGGTLYAKNLIVTTNGESSAAIRSDRGGGAMVVDGGSYTSNGSGSPAVYVTADITVSNATLTATGSEALCLEGLNSVRLTDCVLSGDMPDLDQNDNTWTVILYQSMSGDSQIGKGTFEMTGGTLVSKNGGLFYTTNTQSEFTLSGVTIEADDADYFLRCTGNKNARGWGRSGDNGADCVFTAIGQEMNGDVIWDSVSTLDMRLTKGSVLTGAFIDDESCAGSGGSGTASLTIGDGSAWIVTGDSVLTNLNWDGGIIMDDNGLNVTIVSADGTFYAVGDSSYTVTLLEALNR